MTTRLLYVDQGFQHPAPVDVPVYEAKDLKPLQKAWEKRVKPMLNDKTFAPRANRWCFSCTFRKDAGGPCKF